ncbi:MAG TPA: AAA family ATPase [Patescibacteria group bacterium]|nr:AAA family ATPase [Patescibacteria group bacterium]
MHADRPHFGIDRGSDERPSNGHVTFVVNGAPLLHRWLTHKNEVADNEALATANGADDSLMLATVKNGSNEEIEGIGSGIIYDTSELGFEIKTVFVPKRDMLDEDRFSLRPDQRDLQRKLREIQRDLVIRLTDTGFSLELDGNKLIIQDSADPEVEYELHRPTLRIPELPGPLAMIVVPASPSSDFCLHSNQSAINRTQEDFTSGLQRYAELAGYVAESIYSVYEGYVPSKTIELKPPANLANKLNSTEKNVIRRKKMLSASGFDSEEEIAAEVQSKVELVERPEETFDDIGGNEAAKEELKTVVDALRNPQAYERRGTRSPKGILLYGPPGTGKTMLTRALAHEANAAIYVVRLADVVHSLYGRTERLVNEVFKQAQEHTPVIILIDELDALGGNRERSNEINSRIVTVLQTNLDGIDKRSDGIVVVGTTNRIDVVDPALKRPGRLDLLVPVQLPDAKQREQILRLKMAKSQKTAEAAGGGPVFNVQFDLARLSSITKDFSGADIEEVIRRALARKVRAEMGGESFTPLTTEELATVIANYETVRKDRKIGFGQS